MDKYWDDLRSFIAMRSVAGDEQGNAHAINFLCEKLQSIGFKVSVKDDSRYGQPCIIAQLKVVNEGSKSIALYNHYDVEPKKCDGWESDPFELTERGKRLYGRGVADNKAVLLARMYVIEQALMRGMNVPNILWLIQGEEECGSKVAHRVFPEYMANSQASFFLEETGYYRNETPLILVQDESNSHQVGIHHINHLLFSGGAHIEHRYMNKFGACPFRENIPNHGCYVAFGPNDYDANIHEKNESISKVMLESYFRNFEGFLAWKGA